MRPSRKRRPAVREDRSRARALRRIAGAQAVAVRELRLLFGLLLILFVTSEVWRYAGRLPAPRLAVIITSALVAVGVLVGVGLDSALPRTASRPIRRRAALRLGGEIAIFGVLLFLVFTALGFVSMDSPLVQEWSGDGSLRVLLEVVLLDERFVLTGPLLQVSACLGALGSVVFAVEVVFDADTRAALLSDLIGRP